MTTRTPIDTAGHWLSPDAAASYLRMIADRLPTGGVDCYGRTPAQQQARIDAMHRGGPLAAGLNGPHVRGVAFDTHTTTAGRYDPSPAHLWLTAGGNGADVTAGEHIRANEYGWVRTVNRGASRERWHFAYLPAKDRHRQPLLRLGSVGAWVKAVQARLDVRTTGFYGTTTRAAVRAYQAANHLQVDGKAGPQTLTHLGITKV